MTFRIIKDFPNYSITSIGRVWNNKYNRWLKSVKQPHGYLTVDLGYRNKQYVHKLVLDAFVGKCPKGMECRHLDGNKANNILSNLRWGTQKDNGQDRIKHGTAKGAKGENHYKAKLTNTDVFEIRYLYSGGLAQVIIANLYEIGAPEISLIVNRKIWRHI